MVHGSFDRIFAKHRISSRSICSPHFFNTRTLLRLPIHDAHNRFGYVSGWSRNILCKTPEKLGTSFITSEHKTEPHSKCVTSPHVFNDERGSGCDEEVSSRDRCLGDLAPCGQHLRQHRLLDFLYETAGVCGDAVRTQILLDILFGPRFFEPGPKALLRTWKDWLFHGHKNVSCPEGTRVSL